jgi:hypothetical protein
MALISNLLQNPSPPHSVTVQGAYEPFDLQIARNQIMGHSPLDIFGFSTTVGSTALGPVWEGLTLSGGTYAYPSSAAQLVLVSDSASDTSALSVQIQGLDANFAPLNETIAMNGTSNVTTVNSFFRINLITTTNGLNVGNITAKIGATTYAKINAGIGQTQMSIYTVPAGYTFYLKYVQVDASIGFTSSNYMKYAEYNKNNVTGEINVLNQTTFVQTLNVPFATYVAHTEKTDIQWQVVSNTGSPFVANVYAGGILIKNDGQTA